MQDWLKDKKNLPIVATLGALVLIGAVVAVLFEMGILPPQSTPVPAPITSVPPGTPPGVPQAQVPPGPQAQVPPGSGPPGSVSPGGAPPQAPAAAAVKAPAAVMNVAKGPDPFKVPGYHPFNVAQFTKELKNSLRVGRFLPAVYIQQYAPKDQLIKKGQGTGEGPALTLTPEVSSTMRMSGVITADNSIKALLESNGVSTEVQPGDTVDGGKVLSIQPDGLTLRTSDNRLVRVPLSSTPTGGNSPYGGGSPSNGGGYPPPGGGYPPPGGGYPPGGFTPPGVAPGDNTNN